MRITKMTNQLDQLKLLIKERYSQQPRIWIKEMLKSKGYSLTEINYVMELSYEDY